MCSVSETIITFILVLAAVSAAPRRNTRSIDDTWQKLCGDASPGEVGTKESLKSIKEYYLDAMHSIGNLRKMYEKNYNPSYTSEGEIWSWLPTGNTLDEKATCEEVLKHLPNLYTALQKCMVGFQEMMEYKDEHIQNEKNLTLTNRAYKLLLYQVQDYIVNRPKSVDSNIIPAEFRGKLDGQTSLIRDWGVIDKCHGYMESWRKPLSF